MRALLWLGAAIAAEIIATSALKMSHGFERLAPGALVVIGYALAFAGLSMSLKTMPLGIVYAVWSGIGTLGAVLAGRYVFRESLSWQQYLGVVVVIAGVALMSFAREGVA